MNHKVKHRNRFPVVELFGPTMQGEGLLAGLRSHFVRFGGCTYRCSWCDSMHSVDPVRVKQNARWMYSDEIHHELTQLRPLSSWLTLTGGDPVMWDLWNFATKVHQSFKVAVETQGAIWRDWLHLADHVTVSVKPPSSGMKWDPEVIDQYAYQLSLHKPKMSLKIVVFDDNDFKFAKNLHMKYPGIPMYLSVGTPQFNQEPKYKLDGAPNQVDEEIDQDNLKALILHKYKWLVEKTIQDNVMRDVRVLPQLHVLVWGTELGR